jgi:hypothetical protein
MTLRIDSSGLAICSHGRGAELPKQLFIGIQHNTWVIHSFAEAAQASRWLAENPEERHVYRVNPAVVAELVYVRPVEATYREERLDGGTSGD